jgi:hypothetical protein
MASGRNDVEKEARSEEKEERGLKEYARGKKRLT